MASPPFDNPFVHWMSASISKAAQTPSTVSADPSASHVTASVEAPIYSRLKQMGLRAHTDESCGLTSGSDVLQHIADSRRGTTRNMVSDLTRDDDLLQEAAGTDSMWDSIAADVNALKEEVDRLKHEKLGLRMPSAGQETTAARLQREHEVLKQRPTKGTLQSIAPAPPSLLEFPTLGSANCTVSAQSRGASAGEAYGERKPSYAYAVAAGIQNAIDQAFPDSKLKRDDSKTSDAVSDEPLSVTSLQSTDSVVQLLPTTSNSRTSQSTDGSKYLAEDEREQRTLLSPQSAKNCSSTDHSPVVQDSTQSMLHGTSPKGSPHFAQPTKSFARRVGETFRKNSISPGSKKVTQMSPTKTVKPAEARSETETRAAQRQQKRTSLPSDWVKTSGQHAADSSKMAAKELDHSPKTIVLSSMDRISPISYKERLVVSGTEDKNAGSMCKQRPTAFALDQQLRKKPSSYMTPTAAATQRAIATLGQDSINRVVVRATQDASLVDSNIATTVARVSSAASDSVSSASAPVHVSQKAPFAGQAFSSQIQPLRTSSKNVDVVAPTSWSSSTSSTTATEQDGLCAGEPQAANHRSRIPCAAETSHKVPINEAHKAVHAQHDRQNASQDAAPAVVNTTLRHRTSSTDILQPILSRLENSGLRKGRAESAYVVARGTENVNPSDSQAARRALPKTKPLRALPAVEQALLDIKTMKPVPPHLRRSRQSSVASTDSESTLIAVERAIPELVEELAPSVQAACSEKGTKTPATVGGVNGALESPCPSQAPRVPSLRATAKEFKPSWTLESQKQEFKPFFSQGTRDTSSGRPSHGMLRDVQHSMQGFSDYESRSFHAASAAIPHQHLSLASALATEGQSTTKLASQPLLLGPGPSTNASTDDVQVVQVLKPILSPGKKTVQCALPNTEGQASPISFGRAPPPAAPIFAHTTPTLSPASDDTSPIKTPRSGCAWTIGPMQQLETPWRYGWKGGDGKEISFKGYGPHAERDPNVPVTMDFCSRSGSSSRSPPQDNVSSHGAGQGPSPARKVWPRSQRQWAELATLSKMPCGNIDISHALEQIPFGQPLVGFCNDCAMSQC